MLILTQDEFDFDTNKVKSIADNYAKFHYYKGYQVAYGVYDYTDEDEKAFLILYAINSVSFMDGSKYKRNNKEYLSDANAAARTVVAEVMDQKIEDNEKYDFRELEYYQEY